MIFSEPSLYGGEDERLAAAMKKSGRVFMPLFFPTRKAQRSELDEVRLAGAAGAFPPAGQGRDKVLQPVPRSSPPCAAAATPRLRPTATASTAACSISSAAGGRVYPSFSLALALFADPHLSLARIPFAADGGLNLKFYSRDSFRRYSISELIQSQVRRKPGQKAVVPTAAFKDKIVIIGATAPGLLDNRSTPVNAIGSGFELHATALANLLRAGFHPRARSPAAVAAGAGWPSCC